MQQEDCGSIHFLVLQMPGREADAAEAKLLLKEYQRKYGGVGAPAVVASNDNIPAVAAGNHLAKQLPPQARVVAEEADEAVPEEPLLVDGDLVVEEELLGSFGPGSTRAAAIAAALAQEEASGAWDSSARRLLNALEAFSVS